MLQAVVVTAQHMEKQMKYTITVRNSQGAGEQYKADSIQDCKDWLSDTWSDPDDMSAEIRDDQGTVVATSPRNEGWDPA